MNLDCEVAQLAEDLPGSLEQFTNLETKQDASWKILITNNL